MKKVLKLTVATIVIFSGLLMVLAKTTKVEANLESANIETQSGLFASQCARCHGGDGKGNTKLGQDLAVPDLTTSKMGSARIKQVITKGDGDMPAFGKKLKPAQITSLTNYVRSLR